MKKYLLLSILIFVTFTQVFAQKPCNDSQPRPVIGEQRPCEGEVKEYKVFLFESTTQVDLSSILTSYKPQWEVPRAFAGEGPVGWQIVRRGSTSPVASTDILPYDNVNTRRGYIIEEVIGAGPNTVYNYYSAVTTLVGRKPGTMKVTIKHPDCGTKIATLPVMPGISFTIVVTGPENPCIGEQYVYNATISVIEKGPKPSNFSYQWHYPAGWTPVGATNGNTITLIPDATTGVVWAEVVDLNNKTNNGNGLGPRGYCASASNQVPVYPVDCENACPAGTFITGATVNGVNVKFTYLGTTVSGAYTTVSFNFMSAEIIDQVLIQPTIFSGTPDVTATVNNGNYTAVFNGTEVVVSKTGDPGAMDLTVTFTTPTADLTEVYGLTIETISGEMVLTDYTGVEAGVEFCEFGELNALAVELTSFQGKATASGIELSWATASEQNNDRFEVQRSTDGHEFRTIGTVKGAGNSATAVRYAFVDKTAAKGTNYYRLNQVDFDGTASLSQVIALENSTAAAAGITVYPNPASGDKLTIALDGPGMDNKTYLISITDIKGSLVFEQTIFTADSNELVLSLSKLKMSKGMYLVKIHGDNLSATQKLMISGK